MNNEEIKSLLITELNLKEAHIKGDQNHIQIIVIGDIFKGENQVKRQQIVYTPLINMISKKHIHAISIIAYTTEEWEKKQQKN